MAAVVLGAIAVLRWPRRIDLVQWAALSAAVLIGFELTLTHWFYLYIPWFLPLVLFVVVPDCGRDSNPFVDVPCQHHFGSRSAHEIFALFFGKGAGQGIVVDKKADQTSIAATVGRFMGFKSPYTDGGVLEEAFA
jgi:hypothetical protein